MKNCPIKPIKRRYVVEKIKKEQVGSIVIPEGFQEWPDTGTIVAVSDDDNMECAVGDVVRFKKHAGTDIELDGTNYNIIKEDQLLAIIKEGIK